jgi:hypothetical protein
LSRSDAAPGDTGQMAVARGVAQLSLRVTRIAHTLLGLGMRRVGADLLHVSVALKELETLIERSLIMPPYRGHHSNGEDGVHGDAPDAHDAPEAANRRA